MIGNETISIFSGYKKKLLGAFLSMLIILIVLVLIIVILVWILTKTDKIDSVLKRFISVSFIYLFIFFNVVSLMLFSFFFEEQCSAVQFLCIMSKVGFRHIERISLIMKFPVHEQTCHT